MQKLLKDSNIRSGAGVNYPTVTNPLKAGTMVMVLNQVKDWTLVKLENGLQGYIKNVLIAPDIISSATLTIVQLILSIARSQLGFTEDPIGSNWGKHVQKYLKAVGITSPAPWCMAFVYWVVNEACNELKIKNPLIRTGGVLDMWLRIDKSFKIVMRPIAGKKEKAWHRWDATTQTYLITDIQVGDIGILNFGEGKGHCYFVEKDGGDRVYTLEGNSNDEGSREGYEVCRKPGGRITNAAKGYLRLS